MTKPPWLASMPWGGGPLLLVRELVREDWDRDSPLGDGRRSLDRGGFSCLCHSVQGSNPGVPTKFEIPATPNLPALRRLAPASPILDPRLAPLADEESVRGPRGIGDRPLHEDLAAWRLGTVRAEGTPHIQEARWVGFIDDAEAYAAAGFPEENAGGPFGPPALPSNRQRSGANQVGELFPLVLVEHLMQTTEGFYDGAAELVGGLHSDRGSGIRLRFVEAGRLDRLGKD